jgi:hypothetical protein
VLPEKFSAIDLAREFHDAYERLAPQFGYVTRSETREFDPDSPNGCLMTEVVREVFWPILTRAVLKASQREDSLRDHQRYEYLRRLNVPQFKAIFERALKGEAFDDVIDACLAGCTPGCRNDDYPGCGICMSPR